jgi:hypothetical protein
MISHEPARTRLAFVLVALALTACHRGGHGSTSGKTPGATAVACDPAWQSTFGGPAGTASEVRALAVFDDGSGPALCAGGVFTTTGGAFVSGVEKWDGAAWTEMATSVTSGAVNTILGFDDGTGPALYAAGEFEQLSGQTGYWLAKTHGMAWTPLGTPPEVRVRALAPFADSGGPALYAAFDLPVVGAHVLKLQGSTWTIPGGGIDGGVTALLVFDDGSGPALYAGGYFTDAGGVPVTNIARWDGLAWSSVGGGLGGEVDALCAFDDGNGPALYAGGNFTLAGGVSANRIAKWDGSSWSALGGGLSGGGITRVSALTVFDDGAGPALFVAGTFASADGVAASGIARYDAAGWSALGSGLNGPGNALAVFGSGEKSALFVGGAFTSAGGVPASGIAQWSNPVGCGSPGVPICVPLAGGVIDCPCGNTSGLGGVGCDNSSATGGAVLMATGIARLTYDTVVFTSDKAVSATPSILLQGNSVSPTGIAFGQGVRCVAGSLKRMYVKTHLGGSITAPEPGDPRVSARSAAAGDVIAAGTHRYYGVYYRDPIVPGSCPAWALYNITQQLDVLWAP